MENHRLTSLSKRIASITAHFTTLCSLDLAWWWFRAGRDKYHVTKTCPITVFHFPCVQKSNQQGNWVAAISKTRNKSVFLQFCDVLQSPGRCWLRGNWKSTRHRVLWWDINNSWVSMPRSGAVHFPVQIIPLNTYANCLFTSVKSFFISFRMPRECPCSKLKAKLKRKHGTLTGSIRNRSEL